MTTYIIGDVQGCYDSLVKLLDKISFDQSSDYIWFCGDLINRGPQSFETLDYIYNLDTKYKCCNTVLGNHDLHLISCYFNNKYFTTHDNFEKILAHNSAKDYIYYLLNKPLFYHNKAKKYCVTHAGINPAWNLNLCIQLNQEYVDVIQSNMNNQNILADFFNNMYGNHPDAWQDNLTGYDRLRIIINSFTRMRYVDKNNKLLLDFKGKPELAHNQHIPWFKSSNHKFLLDHSTNQLKLFFGHWAALDGKTDSANIIGLDTGCVYGGTLTAYSIEDDCKISV